MNSTHGDWEEKLKSEMLMQQQCVHFDQHDDDESPCDVLAR